MRRILTSVVTSLVVGGLGCLASGCAVADDAQEEDVESASQEVGSSCSSSLASGAVASKHRAMLNTIAYTEGTAGSCGNDGYSTGYGYNCFSSCARHPNRVWHGGGWSSTAAGRYQFLNRTWNTLGLGNFGPRNQDVGAMSLISRRGVTLPTSRALSATEFSNAMRKLSLEWASLPFSPYGQPTVPLSRARAKYCGFAGC